jgi:hypothetical protein
MNRTIAPVFLGLFALPLVAACGATVTVDGDGNESTGTEGQCNEVCDAMPSCAPYEYEVSECVPGDGGACRSVYACCTEIFCQEAVEECWEGPYCAGGYEVDSCPSDVSCYDVTACGITIHCVEEVFCDGYPSCDAGDVEVSECPADAGCYSAEMCGGTILCMDGALPQHGCPPSPPPSGTACDPNADASFCDYPTNGDCFESYACQLADDTYVWSFVGGGCTGNGGG